MPDGEIWTSDAIAARRHRIEAADLGWMSFESLPVHQGIRTCGLDRDRLIAPFGPIQSRRACLVWARMQYEQRSGVAHFYSFRHLGDGPSGFGESGVRRRYARVDGELHQYFFELIDAEAALLKSGANVELKLLSAP